MQEFTIRLHSVQEVQKLVSFSTVRPYKILVSDGRYIAKGESFMEMFCLALDTPLTVTAHCTEEELAPLLDDLRPFLVE